MRVVAGRCADVWFSEALSDCTLSCHRRNGAGPRAETAHSVIISSVRVTVP